MAMTPRVKSASKRDFLGGLGLDPHHPGTQALYTKMKVREARPEMRSIIDVRQDEACRAFTAQMRDNRALLKPEYARTAPPFAANQFTDIAFRSVVRSIWIHACVETKVWYDRARTHDGDNWIISWMLYHVCRYRDPRNIRATSSDFHDDDDLDEGSSSHGKDPRYFFRGVDVRLTVDLQVSSKPNIMMPQEMDIAVDVNSPWISE